MVVHSPVKFSPVQRRTLPGVRFSTGVALVRERNETRKARVVVEESMMMLMIAR